MSVQEKDAAEDEFDPSASAAALDLDAINGKLLLLKPTKIEEGVVTALGTKDATVADVAVLDGDDAVAVLNGDDATVLKDVFVWPKVLQAQLKPKVATGRYVLGRLGRGTAKPGQNAPWKLFEADDADKKVARAFILAERFDF